MRWSRHARPAIAALVTVVLVAGCGNGAADPQRGSTVPESSPAASALTEPNEALLIAHREDGLDEAQAFYLALTRLDGVLLSEQTARLSAWFPTGNEAEFTVTLTRDVAGDPAAPPTVEHAADDGFRFRMEYVISDEAIPAELTEAPTVVLTSLHGTGIGPDAVASGSSGTRVVVEAVVKQLHSSATSEVAKLLEERLANGAEINNLLKSLKAGGSVLDALSASEEYQALVREIDAIVECARTPTNPVTQQAYEEDPGYRDRILEQIAAVRDEVQANTAVSFLSQMIKTGSGLVPKVPWLGFVIGPGTAWSKAALTEVNRKLIDDLRKNVTPCEQLACTTDREPLTRPDPAASPDASPAAGTSSPPPVDPCQADGHVTTLIEWDTNTPAPNSGWWLAGGSVTFEVDPDATFDGYRTFELTHASLTVAGEFRSVNPSTGAACVTAVPEQPVTYTNPLGPNHYGHPNGSGQISLDMVGVEGVPEFPPGNYSGQISLSVEVKGTVTCTAPGEWPAEWSNDVQPVVPLVIRSPLTHPDAPTFVVDGDGRMSGHDTWDEPMLLSGVPGRITSTWNFVPVGD